MNIIGTGLSGLVGSRIIDVFGTSYTFENLSLETGVDITNKEDIEKRLKASNAAWVFHFAAYTDVQGAEKERPLGPESVAWKVNVLATEHIAFQCKKLGKKLVYIDTDYAFDGKNSPYSEDAKSNPLGWYAATKTEGASRVIALNTQGLVVRISNPYRAHPVGKKDFVHKMLDRMLSGSAIVAPADQLFVPTFIDDLAIALEALIKHEAHGIYHVVSANALSPYEAAMTIAREYSLDMSLVQKTTFAKLFEGRAPVPQYAELTMSKLHALGVYTRSFEEGIREMKAQEARV